MSKPETRYKCDKCGCKSLQRQFYIWRDESKDDPEAFDIQQAEPTDMGSDWWCPDCQEHTFGQEYDARAATESEAALARFARDILGHLETEEEWGSDTLNYISNSAVNYGLAAESHAFFTLTEDAKQ